MENSADSYQIITPLYHEACFITIFFSFLSLSIHSDFSLPLRWLWYTRMYSKTCVKRPLSKRAKTGFQDKSWLNAGQKYCILQHSTLIKLPFVNQIFVFSIFDLQLKAGFTVPYLSFISEQMSSLYQKEIILTEFALLPALKCGHCLSVNQSSGFLRR